MLPAPGIRALYQREGALNVWIVLAGAQCRYDQIHITYIIKDTQPAPGAHSISLSCDSRAGSPPIARGRGASPTRRFLLPHIYDILGCRAVAIAPQYAVSIGAVALASIRFGLRLEGRAVQRRAAATAHGVYAWSTP